MKKLILILNLIFMCTLVTASYAQDIKNEEEIQNVINVYNDLILKSGDLISESANLFSKETITSRVKKAANRKELDDIFSQLELEYTNINREITEISDKIYFIRIRAIAAGIPLDSIL